MLPILNLYTCRETLLRLNDYLDRELSEPEMKRVRRHLRICHRCARKFSFEANLLAELKAKINCIDMPDGLAERISISLASTSERDTGP